MNAQSLVLVRSSFAGARCGERAMFRPRIILQLHRARQLADSFVLDRRLLALSRRCHTGSRSRWTLSEHARHSSEAKARARRRNGRGSSARRYHRRPSSPVHRMLPTRGHKRAAGMILSAHDPAALPLASMAGNSERQYCNRQRDARPIVRTTAAWCLLQ